MRLSQNTGHVTIARLRFGIGIAERDIHCLECPRCCVPGSGASNAIVVNRIRLQRARVAHSVGPHLGCAFLGNEKSFAAGLHGTGPSIAGS